MEVAYSTENSVDFNGYTALYPTRQNSSYKFKNLRRMIILVLSPNLKLVKIVLWSCSLLRKPLLTTLDLLVNIPSSHETLQTFLLLIQSIISWTVVLSHHITKYSHALTHIHILPRNSRHWPLSIRSPQMLMRPSRWSCVRTRGTLC
jgi:hypothetical protein